MLNGCTDNTLGVVQKVSADFPEVRALEFRSAIGKGGALIEGLRLASLGDLIGYVDADRRHAAGMHSGAGQTHPARADCVIGSRWLPGAVIHASQSSKRQFASRVFHFIVQLLFWLGIRDTQCGAKVMKREVVDRIHDHLQIADMAFDINLLVAIRHAGFKTLEVPTEWTDQIGSKVALTRTYISPMLLSVIRIRLIYWPWLYRLLRPLRPLEVWLYKKLRAPQPLSSKKN